MNLGNIDSGTNRAPRSSRDLSILRFGVNALNTDKQTHILSGNATVLYIIYCFGWRDVEK